MDPDQEDLLELILDLAPPDPLEPLRTSLKKLRQELTPRYWIFLSARETLHLLFSLQAEGLLYLRDPPLHFPTRRFPPKHVDIYLTLKGRHYFTAGDPHHHWGELAEGGI